jgi:hypothetical protein
LWSLSSDPADRKIILAAIAHSDLRDLQLKEYFLLVQFMAARGEDTSAAAFHILEQPKFEVFIPQHDLTLGQDDCLVYMLLPTNPDFWIQPAIQRLRIESDVVAKRACCCSCSMPTNRPPAEPWSNSHPIPVSPKLPKPNQASSCSEAQPSGWLHTRVRSLRAKNP